MTSANVELVRSIFADWERGDFGSAEWAHPEIEFVRADGPSPGHWTGLAGLIKGTRDWLDTWEDVHVEADEYRELDDQRVLALLQVTGRGKRSGLELARMGTKGANLFHLRDGKVIRIVHYLDRERAFSDLGLERTD